MLTSSCEAVNETFYAGYDLKGKCLHQYWQVPAFGCSALAAENGMAIWVSATEQFIFMQDLSTDNYYGCNHDNHDG